jgi:lipopolysaccharide transport system ATP-binding protein
MSDVIASARGLGKMYRLGPTGGLKAQYSTLRESIVGALRRPFQRPEPREEFWALRDVSFDVQRGDVVGIIGRNGAGKSTLLKILSRITDPTQGEALLLGRVGSLLEVGTGFHPELSGRENIYLNGSILGMKRREIARQFDEIVAFAEVEKFIDTPVKFYSSGMYTRLAFAVAAHLEPEILIVDEVLAVGDAEFQKKCLGKMSDIAKGGRTVLFVSHNMAAVERLCNRCLLLEQGSLVVNGSVSAAVGKYLASSRRVDGRLNAVGRTCRDPRISIRDAWLEQRGQPTFSVANTQDLALLVETELHAELSYAVELTLRQQDGSPVAMASSGIHPIREFKGRAGDVHTLRCSLPPLTLAKGDYSFDLMLSVPYVTVLESIESAIGFSVDSSVVGESHWSFSQSEGRGCCYLDVEYSARALSTSTRASRGDRVLDGRR